MEMKISQNHLINVLRSQWIYPCGDHAVSGYLRAGDLDVTSSLVEVVSGCHGDAVIVWRLPGASYGELPDYMYDTDRDFDDSRPQSGKAKHKIL